MVPRIDALDVVVFVVLCAIAGGVACEGVKCAARHVTIGWKP